MHPTIREFICSTIKTVLHFFCAVRNVKIMSAAFSILKRNKPVELIRLQTGISFIQFVINRRRSREMKSMQLMYPHPGLGYGVNVTRLK